MLAAQAIVGTWPLPNGTLLGPRFLSNISDAPYLGKAAMLFAFTRMPVNIEGEIGQINLPLSVYIGIFLFICLGSFEVLATIFRTRRIYKRNSKYYVPAARLQVSAWFALIIAAVLIWTISSVCIGLIILLTAQLVPFRQKKRSHITGAAIDAPKPKA